MKKVNLDIEIKHPNKQLYLYGYKKYMDDFDKLFKGNKLPKVALISGPKGIGKSTFVYHFINYLLSENENYKYSLTENKIDMNNKSFELLQSEIHPNVFCIDKANNQKNITIEEVRRLLNFLNKSTYLNGLKFVVIDNAENLNINSANLLLKTLEEPNDKTFIFIIHNNLLPILTTIKSRCIQFKIFFNHVEKRKIFSNLLSLYNLNTSTDNFNEDLFYETPGNLIKYYSYIKNDSRNNDYLSEIQFFIEKFKREKNYELLSLISLLIEKFYKKTIFQNKKSKTSLFINRSQILRKIYLLTKFNLDVKNIFSYISTVLKNEAK